MRIEPRRTFRTIIASSSNQRAIALAKDATERACGRPNPLLVCGPTGVGKSLLLCAVGNELTRHGYAPIAALTAEQFRNGYVRAIRAGTMADFRRDLDNADALLVDGLEDLASTSSVVDELCRAMSVAIGRDHPVVLACGPAFSEQLAAVVRAFPAGVVVEIGAPTLKQRHTGLERLARTRRRRVPRIVLTSIARTSQTIAEACAKLDALLLSTQRVR